MISAKQARTIVGPSKEDYLEVLERRIIKAAEGKNYEVILYDKPYVYWLYDAKHRDATVEAVLNDLRELGYQVSLYYNESQFVDMGLKISWQA